MVGFVNGRTSRLSPDICFLSLRLDNRKRGGSQAVQPRRSGVSKHQLVGELLRSVLASSAVKINSL